MWFADDIDLLEIAIRAGMIVRPEDIAGLAVIDDPARLVRLRILAVEEMRFAHAAERADRAAQVHMVARHQQTGAVFPKAADRGAILWIEAVARVDCEQPEFVIIGLVDRREYRIGAARRGAIPGRHLAQGRPVLIGEPGEIVAQHREATDIPVVFDSRDRRLEQDADRRRHWFLLGIERAGQVGCSTAISLAAG